MSRVERGSQVARAIRHSRWNAQSDLNCPDRALSRPRRATAGSTMRNTKPVSEASEHQSRALANETAESKVRDLDRLTEPVWACRVVGMAASISSSLADTASRGKAGHLWVHGLLIGTSEPVHSRRSVADRLTLRSRVTAVHGGGVPVVVRGRESRPHGEGEQVPRRSATKET